MANHFELGNHRFTLAGGALRVESIGPGGGLPVAPVLSFRLCEAGHAPVPVRVLRISQNADRSIVFHGASGQHVTLDGTISAEPEVGGFVVEAGLVNVSEQMRVALSVDFSLPGEADPRWLVPGFFYVDNRPPGSRRLYPAYSEIERDHRRLISSSWAFRSDRAATPFVGCWTYGVFAWISADPIFGQNEDMPEGIGMTGLHLGSEDGQPAVGVDFPYRETPAKFSFCHEDRTEAEETFADLPLQTVLPVRFRFGMGAPDLHAYAPVLKFLYREFVQLFPVRPHPPLEIAERDAHVGLLRWHYDSRQKAIFESAAFDRHFGRNGAYIERPFMHAGWLGGILSAYTLIWAGRESNHEESIKAGIAVIDKFAGDRSPCGTIFPVWAEEKGWACSFGPEDGLAHSRTVAEGILFLLRAIAVELRHGESHPQWAATALSSLTYAMGAQRADGCFPSYYDLTTGRPVDYHGCGGLSWVAALAIGASLLDHSYFREVALRGGEYYSRFVLGGFLYGSIEDQPCTPSSDDCYIALIAYLALYEVDHDDRWLDLARKSADLALTWRFSYNVAFDPGTILDLYQIETRGGDISSLACPVTGCGGLIAQQELIKLSTYLGEDYYRQRAEDARRFASQLVVTEEGMLNGRLGMVAAQIFHTDWWQPKGIVLSLSQAISATLVKFSALTSRKLAAHATISDTPDLPPSRPVLYADMTSLFPEEVDDEHSFAGLSAHHDRDGHPGERRSAAGAVLDEVRSGLQDPGPSAEAAELRVAPSLRERSSRGLSSENVPLPNFGTNEPIPYPDFKPAEEEEKPEETPPPETGDVEIKYKIF